jgi:hypothetical protein
VATIVYHCNAVLVYNVYDDIYLRVGNEDYFFTHELNVMNDVLKQATARDTMTNHDVTTRVGKLLT